MWTREIPHFLAEREERVAQGDSRAVSKSHLLEPERDKAVRRTRRMQRMEIPVITKPTRHQSLRLNSHIQRTAHAIVPLWIVALCLSLWRIQIAVRVNAHRRGGRERS